MEKRKEGKISAYLAHPLKSRKYIREWELKFEEKFSIELLNPFYDLGGLETEITKQRDEGKEVNFPEGYFNKLVQRDLTAVLNSDFVVAFVDGSSSYGTIMEICYAHMFGKAVFIIATAEYAKGHEWLLYHSTTMFNSIEEF